MSSNSIKIYQTCSIHPLEEEKNICINPRCLTAKDVKLVCIDCQENHVQQKGNNQHKKIHYSKFLEQCNEKQKLYQKIQEMSIVYIQQFKEKAIEQLNKMLENIQHEIEDMKKYFKGILEEEIRICKNNLQQASEAMKDEQNTSNIQNFQNFIYFFILDEKNLEKQINEHNKDLEQKIQYYLDEQDLLHEEYCKYKFDPQIYQQMDSFEIKITPIPSQEVKIDQCDIHKVECNYMCTDAMCSIQKPQQPHCIMCIHNDHQKLAQEHKIKQIYDVRAEQVQKINRIAYQKEKTKIDLQTQLKDIIKDIENKQNTANKKFHIMKIRAHEIYEEIIAKYVNQIDSAEYLIDDIDKKLLQKSLQEIDDDAQNWMAYFGKKISEIHQPDEDYKIKIDSIQSSQDLFLQQIQAQKQYNSILKKEKQDLETKIKVDQVTRLEEFIRGKLQSYEEKIKQILDDQTSDSTKKDQIFTELQKIRIQNEEVLAQIKQDSTCIKNNQTASIDSINRQFQNVSQAIAQSSNQLFLTLQNQNRQPPFSPPQINQQQSPFVTSTNNFIPPRTSNPTKNNS